MRKRIETKKVRRGERLHPGRGYRIQAVGGRSKREFVVTLIDTHMVGGKKIALFVVR
jgi:hypothetical protein